MWLYAMTGARVVGRGWLAVVSRTGTVIMVSVSTRTVVGVIMSCVVTGTRTFILLGLIAAPIVATVIAVGVYVSNS